MATSPIPNAYFQPSNAPNNVVFLGNDTASPISNQEAYFWRVAALVRRDRVLAEQLHASALAEPRLAPPTRAHTLPQCYNNNKMNFDPRVQFQAASLEKQYMPHVYYSRDRSSGDANAYNRPLWINSASRGIRKPVIAGHNPAARLMQYGYMHGGGVRNFTCKSQFSPTGGAATTSTGGRRQLMAMSPRVLNAFDTQDKESDDGIDLTLRL